MNSFKMRDQRKQFYRSWALNFDSKNYLSIEKDLRVEVSLYFDRELMGDDIKMLWLITQKWNDYLKLSIKAKEIQNESLFIQSEFQNKDNCLSKLFSKKNVVWSYRYFDDIEEQINFHLLIKFAYASFLIHLMVWFLIPIMLKHPEWGKGLLWIAHFIFAAYVLSSFIVELVIFRTLFKKKVRNILFDKSSQKFTYFVIIVYLMLGVMAKGDAYTDIAFLVEVQKCYIQKDGLYGGIVLLIASIVFFLTLSYQLFLFINLLWKTPTSTFCPLTSQTTRLLMCSDSKFLAMVVDKFTVTYYDKFLFWRFPTYKILVFSKLILEDVLQWIIQIIYLVLEKRENKSLPTIILSLSFTFPCIAISIYILTHYAGSTLNKWDYEEMVNSKSHLTILIRNQIQK